MSTPIAIFHPAAFRFVPRGGRREKLGLVGIRTPMALTEVDPSGFDRVGRLRQGVDNAYGRGFVSADRTLWSRDGSLWTQLRSRDGAPMERRALVDFLESEGPFPRDDASDLACHFSRTPALASLRNYDRRKADVVPAGMREVVVDGTDRARADLAGLVNDDIAIVEGIVRVRLRSVVARYWNDWNDIAPERPDRHTIGVSLFPRQAYHAPAAGRIDRPVEFMEFLRRNRRLRIPEGQQARLPGAEGLEAYLGLECDGPFPYGLAAGGEVTLFANYAHSWALGLTVVDEAIRQSEARGDMPAATRAAIERSRHWEALGSMSAIRPGEIGDSLEDFRALATQLRNSFRRPANSHSLDELVTGLDEVVLPGLRDLSGVAALDESDLAGLAGPGR